MTQGAKSTRLAAIFIALFVVFLWATSWVLIKIGLEEIPPLTFAGLRYMLAFICLMPFAFLVQRKPSSPSLTRPVLWKLLGLGLLLYALTQGAVFLALAYLPAVTVNLLWSFSTIGGSIWNHLAGGTSNTFPVARSRVGNLWSRDLFLSY